MSRAQYAATGVTLMGLKYLLDSAVLFFSLGITLSPVTYVSPLLMSKADLLANSPSWLVWLLALMTLPFAWVGLSMTVRRAQDAGLSTWLAFLFLVPGINYLLMLGLCLFPSRGRTRRLPSRGPAPAVWKSAMLGVFAALLFSVLILLVSTKVLGTYGAALFVGTPLAMGAISSFTLNRRAPTTLRATLGVAVLTVLLAAGTLLIFGLEGAICIAMAFPPSLAFVLLGAFLGRTVALKSGQAVLGIWLLPGLVVFAGFEALPGPVPVREVVSSIEIEAPPEQVWPHVVSFSELPAPREWIFRTGIAYPKHARIQGEGVGAVRRCEFSTGPFIEPIRRWDPPQRLAFDVASQPAPMEEWSPYRELHPPHLDGYFRSRRGEFRLIALPARRTRLEGSTWYELDLSPSEYWRLWADGLVHAIHLRVLEHVKREVEQGRQR